MSEYDTDILLWSEYQAALLRRRAAGELVNESELDWLNLAEEIATSTTSSASITRTQSAVTQFGRALSALNIDIICANSPQAKGRVERAFGTLQDRLVKDLRLAGIATIEAANVWYLGSSTPTTSASAVSRRRPRICTGHGRMPTTSPKSWPGGRNAPSPRT